ncbi:MAG: translation initiation factor IF-2 [Alphaproteobacteria bacterium]
MGDHSQDPTPQKEKKRLSLGKAVGGTKLTGLNQVRQSFSHGRSKTVTVEVKKKRLHHSSGPESEKPSETLQRATAPQFSADFSHHLTHEEHDTRLRALKEAMQTAAEEALLAEKQAAELELQRAAEAEKTQQEKISTTEEATQVVSFTEEPPSVPLDLSLGIKIIEKKKSPPRVVHPPKEQADEEGEEATPPKRRPGRTESSDTRKTDVRRSLKQVAWRSSDEEDEDDSTTRRSFGKKRRKKQFSFQQNSAQKVLRDLTIPDFITAQELASRMAEKVGDVIKILMNMGVLVTQNQSIDGETAELVANELGHRATRTSESDIERDLTLQDDAPEHLVTRAPVVTVMGHVDHGKTSLLDALRKTNHVASEAGGITQHIGAYQVSLPSGKRITFIDTPGHAAFTEMRSRGAHATDIVVLVVAADDGVKDQTVEAIHHARAAGVPIVVAINKIDKPGANPDHVRQMLLHHEIILEHLGGDVLDVEVSAKTGLNLDKLEETILLQAEILDLKANPDRLAEGVVVEARLEKGRGPVATILVQKGTLKVGDIFVAGKEWGRVRALIDDHGKKVLVAGPSMPVEVSGFSAPPSAGDLFVALDNEARAREIAEFRERQAHQKKVAVSASSQSWEEILAAKASGTDTQVIELPLILKVDTQGSLEALTNSLEGIAHEEVRVRLLHGAVGAITESDAVLAKASRALIVGFNVRANLQAREIAKKENLDIRYYSVIYNILDDVKAALSGLLSPTLREQFLGNAVIRQVFNVTKTGKVAGCMVTEGMVKRGAKVRLLRDHIVIHEGALKTLKRLKDEVKEVREGYECGMAFENYQDIREGDIIECFEIEEIQRSL